MEKISCADMVQEYLKKNGYDGLCEPNLECACKLDDLMPCSRYMAMECVAGHEVKGCNDGCVLGCDFHIVPGLKD